MEANTQKENVEYPETNPQTSSAADADIFRRKFPKYLPVPTCLPVNCFTKANSCTNDVIP